MNRVSAIAPAPLANGDRTRRIDMLLAMILACFLSVCWAITDWHRVGGLILPDTDDMMRLAQVRDWLAGQAFNDWTQYRMAPPLGAPMHWSRINDFGIAGIILAVTPFLGRHGGEVAAVLIYPAILFACNIFLSCRIARRLWGADAGPVTAVLAALAYPGISLFIPGRIDHHALQIVVVEVLILALMQRPSRTTGIIAGTGVAVCLMIGLETAPQVAVLIGALSLFWVIKGEAEQKRMAGFALSLGAATAFFLVTMRPTYWSNALCDAFTPASSSGALAVAAAFGTLAFVTPRLTGWRSRLVVGMGVGAITVTAIFLAYPVCLDGPYAAVDPFLRRAFLPYIGEANSILQQPSFAHAISIAGLLLAGCVAAIWMVARRPDKWLQFLPLVAVIFVSALVIFFQVRGTNIGAPVVTPVLAGLVLAARQKARLRTAALVGAWLVSSGISYAAAPAVAARLTNPGVSIPTPTTPQISCNTAEAWRAVDRYPPGITMAPTNVAAYLIGATHLSTVGAGYHRNNRGNMAMYRYFLGRPRDSAAIAREWNVSYVAFCPNDFAEIDVTRAYPYSLATMLLAGHIPAGFHRLPLHGARLRLYRISK